MLLGTAADPRTRMRPVIVREHDASGADESWPSVLMLHGMASNGNGWDSLCQLLPGGWRLWRAELPWRADSMVEWGHHPDPTAWTDEAIRLVHEATGRVDIVIAHSFSATLLLNLLGRRYPGLPGPIERYGLRGIVAVAPFFRRKPQDFDWDTMAGLIDMFLLSMKEGIRVVAAGRGSPDLHDAMAQRVCEQVGPYGWTRFFDQYLRTPWVDETQVTVPALVVSGDADLIAPSEEARGLAETLLDAEHRVIAGSGHFPMIEKPDEFAALMTGFMRMFSTDEVEVGR